VIVRLFDLGDDSIVIGTVIGIGIGIGTGTGTGTGSGAVT